jgi:hypothetical protein
MTQIYSNSKYHEKFSSIVGRAIFIGTWTPSVPWAWSNLAKTLKESIPIALDQVIAGSRSLYSLLPAFGIIVGLIINVLFILFLLNKFKKELIDLYKEECINYSDMPIKTFLSLIKVTVASILLGGSAYLVSKFIVLG